MSEKSKDSGTVDAVWDIAAPIAEELGFILWDVKYLKEGANWYLKIVIDKKKGITIDDCVAMNDALDAPLTEANLIKQSYNLQVSSPGIERELVRDFHFKTYLGADVVVEFNFAVNGAKIHQCALKGYDNGKINLLFADNEERVFGKKEISSIRLDDFDDDF